MTVSLRSLTCLCSGGLELGLLGTRSLTSAFEGEGDLRDSCAAPICSPEALRSVSASGSWMAAGGDCSGLESVSRRLHGVKAARSKFSSFTGACSWSSFAKGMRTWDIFIASLSLPYPVVSCSPQLFWSVLPWHSSALGISPVLSLWAAWTMLPASQPNCSRLFLNASSRKAEPSPRILLHTVTARASKSNPERNPVSQ